MSGPPRRGGTIQGVEETQQLHGRAFRAGKPVCENVEITVRWEERVGGALPAGANRELLRDRSLRGPSTMRFLGEMTADLRAELEALAAAARDPAERRRQSETHWAPKPIDVVLDKGPGLTGCRLSRPLEPTGSLTELEFDVRHEEL